MSMEARQALANDSRLVANQIQKADILDTSKTNTYLILFMQKLLDTAGHPILVTALNSDHKPGTWHNPPGRGLDCWHADWELVGDAAILDVMNAAAKIGNSKDPYLIEVGLSGDAARCMNQVNWGSITNVFVEDWGDSNEHVHFAVGVPT